MAGESYEAHFALLFGRGEGLEDAVGIVGLLRVVLVDHFVHLAYIQMISLQANERLFQHPHGNIFLSAVSTNLGHNDSLVTFSLERRAHPLFAHAAVIFPCVIEEVYPVVEGLGDHVIELFLAGRRAEVISTESDDRELKPCASHRPFRDLELGEEGSPYPPWKLATIGFGRVECSPVPVEPENVACALAPGELAVDGTMVTAPETAAL